MPSVLKNLLKLQLVCLLLMACVMCDNVNNNNNNSNNSNTEKIVPAILENRKNHDKNVKITYQKQMSSPHGDFYYEFQTDNAITTKAAGNINGISGVLQYVSLEGVPITMTYTADANGYHPSGDHIPKVPDYILRSLEYIRTHAKHVDNYN